MEQSHLYELIERTGALFRAEERRLARQFDLHPVHIRALRYLTRCNRYSDNPAAVAEYLCVTKGTTSQTLRLLKQRGLIEGHPDQEDARKQHLVPTSDGVRTVDKCTPPPGFTEALAGMQGDLSSLSGALETLLRGLQRSNGFRLFGLCDACGHLQRGPARPKFRCGLTGETLSYKSTLRICREFQDSDGRPD